MGQPLVGKRDIARFFGTGWRRVVKYMSLGAPIVKAEGSSTAPYEADRKLLELWWERHIREKLVRPASARVRRWSDLLDYEQFSEEGGQYWE